LASPSEQTIVEAEQTDEFQMKGGIVLVHPDTGETDMVVGGNKTIEWTPEGNIAKFRVRYKTSSGGSYSDITPAGGVTGVVEGPNRTWEWTDLPDTISSDVWFRVEDQDNDNVGGDSTGANTIIGSIDLTAPDGSDTLTIGTPFDITWTKTGSIGNVMIEYSTDDFDADTRTVIGSYTSASPYGWTPTAAQFAYGDMNQDILKVRLTSIGGIPVTDKSAGVFKVKGIISAVQPSGVDDILLKDGDYTVTWSQTGNIGTVDIYYKLNDQNDTHDTVTVDTDHPITVTVDPETGALSPYVVVRDRIPALISRPIYYQLVELGVEEEVDRENLYGVWSSGTFFPLGKLDETP